MTGVTMTRKAGLAYVALSPPPPTTPTPLLPYSLPTLYLYFKLSHTSSSQLLPLLLLVNGNRVLYLCAM